jgi:hypothetical protein
MLKTLKTGDEITWAHYAPELANPEPTTLTGTVVEPATEETGNRITAETPAGTRFVVRQSGQRLVSGASPDLAAAASPAAASVDASPETDPESEPEGEPVTRIQTPIGIVYYGPAYHQALDMLVEILGSEVKGAGHVSHGEQDHHETLYCIVLETEPDLDKVAEAMQAIEGKIGAHKYADYFGEVGILNEDQARLAASTTSAGTLPILKS